MSPPSIHRFAFSVSAILLATALAFSVVGLAGPPSLSATEFDPETDHAELASAPNIHDADRGSPPRDDVREAFEAATDDGHYEGTIPNASTTYSFLWNDRYEFVRFEGTFYEFEANVDGESIVVEADERSSESVADELAVSLENASAPAREAIETGEPVEAPDGNPESSIVVDDGTYYVLTLGHGSGGSVGVWSVIVAVAILVVGVVGVATVGGTLWLRRRRGT
ncbi:hypothetical protein [Natrarchaeobius oligotrophus]|uniref:Uncharacterized protein n=1 Tax=Natrarchaeobius chitinivorans TaxID=1679083 RepID=A0A3N6MBS4_NATCH|nr:hypothetical protein [Natrarchaeobius chitinivorans]RQH00058.1 hypothetical protein EA472_12670 [Natrarchaeobius chitinivorans]